MSPVPTMLPRPLTLEPGDGRLLLTPRTSVVAPDDLADAVARLTDVLRPATGLPLRWIGSQAHASADAPVLELALDDAQPEEGYRLEVRPDGARIAGGSERGVLWGIEAFRQLLPPEVHRRGRVDGVEWSVPAVTVVDAPAFAWRGAMLDVVRHFLPKADILRFVDLLAMHRLNTLHLHLTDDQGWRIEIPRYPRLTEVGAWRASTQIGVGLDAPEDGRPHGGFYTLADLAEIDAYAAARGVTLVPEVELPGHAHAAIAAYPELGVTGGETDVWTRFGIDPVVFNTEESTIEVLTHVLDTVMDTVRSRVIMIGGDECPKDQWAADPRTQELMRERGIATEDDLQAWFVRRIEAHVASRGRRAYGFDEILEGDGIGPSAIVASWRGMTGAVVAARRGHDVVACPDDLVYLDYRQSEDPDEPIPVSIPITVRDAYGFDPVPPELTDEEARHVLGGQANIWAEFMDSARRIDYQAFPRLAAIAEALWSADAGTGRDVEEFVPRLSEHLARLDAVGVEYRHADGPRPWERIPGVPGRPATRAERQAYMDEVTANIAG